MKYILGYFLYLGKVYFPMVGESTEFFYAQNGIIVAILWPYYIYIMDILLWV